jgi:hypothetical protein
MKIVKSTDNKHLGKEISSINKGDCIDLDGFTFEVQSVSHCENGNIILSNPNYLLECEEQ